MSTNKKKNGTNGQSRGGLSYRRASAVSRFKERIVVCGVTGGCIFRGNLPSKVGIRLWCKPAEKGWMYADGGC